MCIICECNVKLTHEEFDSCFIGNSHGAGFAWRGNDGMNHYKKGFMDKGSAWEAYQDVPIPHIAHFRLASAGGVSEELTHPFIVSKESPLPLTWGGKEALVFHNGTISDWRVMLFGLSLYTGLPTGGMSDTRFVAMALSTEKLGIDALCFFISSKFGMLDTDGKIYRYGTWEQDGENWYSNGGYKRAVYVSSAPYVYTGSRWGSPYGGYSEYGDDDLDAISVPDRSCLNCRSFKESSHPVVVPIGTCAGKSLVNILKCVEWAQKRKPGRPRSKRKAEREARKAEEKLRKLEGKPDANSNWEERKDVRDVRLSQPALPFNRSTEPYTSCLNCNDYLGQNRCVGKEYPMANLVSCTRWKLFKSNSLPVTVGSSVVIRYDENGKKIMEVEERGAI
jgi:hypothetical protein